MRISFLLLPLLGACAGSSSIPATLADIEGTAEDAYDKALVSDYAAVSDDASALDSGWASFRDQAATDGAADADLSAMDDAIAGLVSAAADQPNLTDLELARAANAVSGPMDELFALYDDPVPASVLALDYGGREVSLDALEVDMTAALSDIGTLETVWGDVKQQVLDAGGDAEAADYDTSLATQADLANAGDATGLLTESNNGLEIVDSLEGVFTK